MKARAGLPQFRAFMLRQGFPLDLLKENIYNHVRIIIRKKLYHTRGRTLAKAAT
jgi:hypothetical protein